MDLKKVLVLTFLSFPPMVNAPPISLTECSARGPAGDTTILPVHLRIPLDLSDLMVKWEYKGKLVHLFRDSGDYLETQDEEYKGRTSLFKNEMSRGNVSLRLTNVTEQDAGTYSLILRSKNIPQDKRKHSVSLCVEKTEGDRRAVTPGEKEEVDKEITQPVPVWVWIILGICGLFVLVGGLTFLVYRHRTRQKRSNCQGVGDDQNVGQERIEMLGLGERQ